ncbi:hypothetical protein QUF54_10030, partial [Candidatus Marithioploca araucensis]|nr:hypothetical protein [Candidatus Marithioploca araucensis]
AKEKRNPIFFKNRISKYCQRNPIFYKNLISQLCQRNPIFYIGFLNYAEEIRFFTSDFSIMPKKSDFLQKSDFSIMPKKSDFLHRISKLCLSQLI